MIRFYTWFLALIFPVVMLSQGTPPSVLTGGSTGTNGSASFLGYITLSSMTDANYTLHPNEWWAGTIVVPPSLTLTAVRSITPPSNFGQRFVLANLSTGGFAVTVNGISVANGSQQEFDYINGAYVAVGGSISTPFSTLATGTNTTANMTVGSGASLSSTGTGTIAATSAPYSGLTGTVPTWNQNTTGNAATATALVAAPSGCNNTLVGQGTVSTGIAANGNSTCTSNAVIQQQTVTAPTFPVTASPGELISYSGCIWSFRGSIITTGVGVPSVGCAAGNQDTNWAYFAGGTGSGSGTVNSGSAYSPTYYPATGTAVSGTTPFTGLQYDSTTGPPAAATSAQIQAAIGGSVYDSSGAAATAQAASLQKTNNLSDVNSQSAAASNIATFIQTQSGCTTSGYVWVPASGTCVASSSGVTLQTNGTNNGSQTTLNLNSAALSTYGICFSNSGSVVTAAMCNNYIPVINGGTGNTTAPTAGQVPVGQTGGSSYVPTTLTPAFIGASAAPALPTAADATFEMMAGVTGNTSTTIVDQTGNGHTGTFHTSTGAPTYTSNGLSFVASQGLDFATGSSITTDLTMCFSAYFNTLPLNVFWTSGYPSILTSSLGSSASGATIGLWYQGVYGNLLSSSPGPGIYSISNYTNATKTSLNNTLMGEQQVCVIKGQSSNSTTDTVYINNSNASYQLQGASGGIQTTGYMSICAGATTFLIGCPGLTIRRIDFFTGQLTGIGSLTQAQAVQKVFAAYYNDLINHGIPLTPTQNFFNTLQESVVGDSIDVCAYITPSTSCWSSNRSYTGSLQPATINSYGIAGVTLFAESASEPWRVGSYCNSQQGGTIIDLGGGTNDANILTVTPLQAFYILAAEVNSLSASGCRVFIRTMISRTGNAIVGGTLDAWANTYNTYIRNLWSTLTKAVGIADWAANPYVGATWASNAGNTSGTCVAGGSTYFTASSIDGFGCTHPTAAAEGASGPITSANNNAHNYTFPTYTVNNPYVLTTTQTLTMTAGQVYTDATACTSCTLTLPDGIGPTGGTYYINTGSGTVTVQGQTIWGQTQTVTGNGSVAAAGAVTLPVGKLVALHIITLPQATAGIKWVF